MLQRGRKGAAGNVVSIAAVGLRVKLTPCHKLTKEEKKIFDLVVQTHNHLRSFDAPLLTAYVLACSRYYKSTPKDAERAGKMVMHFATKLRLTPQSGMQVVQLGRRYSGPDNSAAARKPWERPAADDDEDE